MKDIKETGRIYYQETEERLAEIEETILEMEENPNDKEAINRLFRAVHTIKGSSALFGFKDVADFAHHMETVLDEVRNGTLSVTKELIDILLKALDHIHSTLSCGDLGERIHKATGELIIAEMDKLIHGKRKMSY